MDTIIVSGNILFRSISDSMATNTYIFIEKNEALLIDPHKSKEIIDLLISNAITKITIIFTHEHADHTDGYKKLFDLFDTFTICQRFCADMIRKRQNNRPIPIIVYLSTQDRMNGTHRLSEYLQDVEEYECHANLVFDVNLDWQWKNHSFYLRHTPGHSRGSCCIILNNSAVFTGDSLILGVPVITRFYGGNTFDYEHVTRPWIKSLPSDLTVLPGHGKIFQLYEAK